MSEPNALPALPSESLAELLRLYLNNSASADTSHTISSATSRAEARRRLADLLEAVRAWQAAAQNDADAQTLTDLAQYLTQNFATVTALVQTSAETRPGAATETEPDHELAELLKQLKDDIEQLTRSLRRKASASGRKLSAHSFPDQIRQPTFQEAKTVAMGIADGPSGRRWATVEGEVALHHAVKDSKLQTKLVGGPLANWLHLPATVETLREELHRAGLPAVMTYLVCLSQAIEQYEVTLTLDDLIKAIGWQPRSRPERERMRQQIWRWLVLFDGLQVVGCRPGRYRDPATKKVLDLQSTDALIRIMGRRDPVQPALDGSAPPIDVTFAAGPWLNQFRGNRQVLADFGDLRKLAAIPAGKPSGAWAQSIGLALHQLWRERSSRADIAYVGDSKKLTVRVGSYTRRDLLDLFPPEPTVEEVLRSLNPRRAREYWRDAINLLKQEGRIGYYQELKPLKAGRQGWAEEWLDQPLDIRPGEDGKQDVAEIAQRAKNARGARAKRRSQDAVAG